MGYKWVEKSKYACGKYFSAFTFTMPIQSLSFFKALSYSDFKRYVISQLLNFSVLLSRPTLYLFRPKCTFWKNGRH